MRGISIILSLLLISLTLFNIGCSDNVSGGVSEEANALLINGNVTDTNGIALDSVMVIAVPSDYIPGESVDELSSLTAYSDSMGYYEIEVDDSTRTYNVYATINKISAIIWNQKSTDTTFTDLRLFENGALRIVLPDSLDTTGGEVFIKGYPHYLALNSSKVDSKAGYAVLFSDLPPCIINEISYRDTTLGSIIIDTLITVSAGDTQTILPENEEVKNIIEYIHINSLNSGLVTNTLYCSVTDEKGSVWYGTGNGVVHFKDSVWTVYTKANTMLGSDVINCIYIDSITEIVWVGFYGGGLAKFQDSLWTKWNKTTSGLPSDNVNDIVAEDGRGLWIATDAGLVLFDEYNDDDTWTLFDSNNSELINSNIVDIDIFGSTKWIACNGGSIAQMNSSDDFVVYNESDEQVLSNALYSITIDKVTGALWVGTHQGLVKFESGIWTVYDSGDWPSIEDRVSTVSIDEEGIIWVGTFSGLLSFDGVKWSDHAISNAALGGKIEDIFIDASNNKWCSLFSNGIIIFNTLP